MPDLGDERPTSGEAKASKGQRGLAALAALFFFAVLTAYFAGHKPVSPDGLRSILAAVGDLLLAAIVIGLGGGIGRRLAGHGGRNHASFLVVQAALGLGCLALLILLLLSTSLLSSASGWALVVLLLLLFGKSSLHWFGSWAALKSFRPVNWMEGAAALAVAALLGMALIEAAAPPVHFDALVYHLDLPQRFLAAHSLSTPTDNLYWGLPLTGEMLYTLAMALGRPQTATVLGFAAALLTGAGVFVLAAEFGRLAGWAALLALFAAPSLAASSGWGYVDWWAALYGFALIAIVIRVDASSPSRQAILAGAMAGFAGGVKYTAAIALPAGFMAICIAAPNRRGLRLGLLFLATGLLVLSPWLLKNAVATGAPLYPYFGGGEGIRQAGLVGSVPAPPLGQSLFVPLAATLLGYEKATGFASDIGPLLVALLPGLALLPGSTRRQFLPVGAYLLTGWLLWAAASQLSGLLVQTRLYFVLLPAWALLAGGGFAGLARVSLGPVRVGRVVGALIALVVGLSLYREVAASVQANPGSAVLAIETRDEYLTRRLGGYYAAQLRMADLPPASRTLMLWEPRGFYCWPACIPDAWIDQWYVARRTLGSPQAIRQAWASQGMTHLLLFNAGMDYVRNNDQRYSEEDWAELDELLQGLTPVEKIGGGYTLFRME
ncbi:MAG TPA: hypothetical protein VJ160_04640 [Anaerolineales bacterium]|nr:hypothetical protein [Anaerolineales bacterium]